MNQYLRLIALLPMQKYITLVVRILECLIEGVPQKFTK